MGTELDVKSNGRLAEIRAGRTGMQLQSMADYWTLSQAIHRSGMGPKGMDATQIMISIQMGAEVGLPPMTSLKNITPINGRPTIWGDTLVALAFHRGLLGDVPKEWIEGSGDNMVAHCSVKRKGMETVVERTFSVEDAKLGKLWQKPGPWQQYPKRMLQVRARGFALRDAFPDALGGFMLREEVEDMEAVDEPQFSSRSEAFEASLRAVGPDVEDVAWSEPQQPEEREGERPEPESRKAGKRKPVEASDAPDGIDPDEVKRQELRDAGMSEDEAGLFGEEEAHA